MVETFTALCLGLLGIAQPKVTLKNVGDTCIILILNTIVESYSSPQLQRHIAQVQLTWQKKTSTKAKLLYCRIYGLLTKEVGL